MRIAVAGAGAMGCRFGSMLHRSGQSVILIDRWRNHIEAIQTNGLRVIHEGGTSTYRLEAVTDFTTVGVADLVMVFTKAMHTQAVVEQALPIMGPHTQVLTLQNGLGNLEAVTSYVPRERVIVGVTNFGTELVAPGVIRALGSGETVMMSAHGQITEALQQICGMMNEAGLHVSIEPDVMSIVWKKVAFNAVYNPLAALTRLKASDIGGYERFDELVNGILDEIVTVAKTEQVDIEKEDIIAAIQGVLDPAMSGEHLTSMLQDVLAQRATEIAFLNGAIVDKAGKYGIAVPYNTLLTHLIRMLESTYEKRIEVLH